MALLNTNTRYLHDVDRPLRRAARRDAARAALGLLLRQLRQRGERARAAARARAHGRAGRRRASSDAYHGNTQALVDVSPYKHAGPGGGGRAAVGRTSRRCPTTTAALHRRDDPRPRPKYAAHVGARSSGRCGPQGAGSRAFLAETLPSFGGQIVLPPGYLAAAYAHVRAAGGVCIADEVQVGFGRVGTHFWGFETQGVVPDIVVARQADRQRPSRSAPWSRRRRSPRRSTTAWSTSTPSAAIPSPAPPASPCST